MTRFLPIHRDRLPLLSSATRRAGNICLLLSLLSPLAALAGPGKTGSHHTEGEAAKPLRVAAFYSSTCKDCGKAKKALAAVEKRWGSKVKVEHRDVKKLKHFCQMFVYEDHYGSDEQAPPKVFVGTQYLHGYPAIGKKLQNVVAEELEKGSVTYVPPKTPDKKPTTAPVAEDSGNPPAELLQRFESFSVGAVAVWSLVDFVRYKRSGDTRQMTLGLPAGGGLRAIEPCGRA